MAQEISLISAGFGLSPVVTFESRVMAFDVNLGLSLTSDIETVKDCKLSNLFVITCDVGLASPSPIFSGGGSFAMGSTVTMAKVTGNSISGVFKLNGGLSMYSDKQSIDINSGLAISTTVSIGSDASDCQLTPHNSNRWT